LGSNNLMEDAAPATAERAWLEVLQARATGRPDAGEAWRSIYGPLVADPAATFVIGQLGQSLDGRIATSTGHSHYINGRAAIVHLHRLRALVDAVVVGVGTVVADDPALTVRHVEGTNPSRVVIDPAGRVPVGAKVFADDGRRRLLVTRPDTASRLPDGVERVTVAPDASGWLPPARILEALVARGLRRILVEGGAATLSRFLEARCLDRLHIAVAPLIIGAGPVGLTLPPIDRLDAALRPPARCHPLGEEMLWDVDLATGRRA
jgi:diaminohydroxyphosphoribosylaminopyrimidine deaminase / 5-amino-6-(5-phosphoribosylamino)uracil reductase